MRSNVEIKSLRPRIPTFGITLILIGLFWLARDLGYIPKEIPIWPFVLILIGLYFILRKPWFESW